MIVAIINLNNVIIGEINDNYFYGLDVGDEIEKDVIDKQVFEVFRIEGTIYKVDLNNDDIFYDKAILTYNCDTGNYIIENITI